MERSPVRKSLHWSSVRSGLICWGLMSGCAHQVKSDVQPLVELPSEFQTFTAVTPEKAAEPERSQMAWWKSFQRQSLDELIERALTQNLELAQAKARLQAARARAGGVGRAAFPQLGLQGRLAMQNGENHTGLQESFEVGLGLNWTLDFFGKSRSAQQAAEYRALAENELRQAVRLEISTEVARTYFQAVAAHRSLALVKSQIETDNELLDLLKLRQRKGLGTNVEVLQQQSRVAESESLLPRFESDLLQAENRLDVLLGTAPDSRKRVQDAENLDFAADFPFLGVKSDLLLYRPDLRATQAQLIALDADIGVAIAERLPSFSLTGSGGYGGNIQGSGPVYSIVGSLLQPLLDWGLRKAEVTRRESLYAEGLARFTQLYLEAVEEVENILYFESRQRLHLQHLRRREGLLQESLKESQARYNQGLDDYFPVLAILQELRGVERRLIVEMQNLVQLRVNLYHALGGATAPLNQDN